MEELERLEEIERVAEVERALTAPTVDEFLGSRSLSPGTLDWL